MCVINFVEFIKLVGSILYLLIVLFFLIIRIINFLSMEIIGGHRFIFFFRRTLQLIFLGKVIFGQIIEHIHVINVFNSLNMVYRCLLENLLPNNRLTIGFFFGMQIWFLIVYLINYILLILKRMLIIRNSLSLIHRLGFLFIFFILFFRFLNVLIVDISVFKTWLLFKRFDVQIHHFKFYFFIFVISFIRN